MYPCSSSGVTAAPLYSGVPEVYRLAVPALYGGCTAIADAVALTVAQDGLKSGTLRVKNLMQGQGFLRLLLTLRRRVLRLPAVLTLPQARPQRAGVLPVARCARDNFRCRPERHETPRFRGPYA